MSKTPNKQRNSNYTNFGERLSHQKLECKKYEGRTTEEIEHERQIDELTFKPDLSNSYLKQKSYLNEHAK